jgi:hypothetical protein
MIKLRNKLGLNHHRNTNGYSNLTLVYFILLFLFAVSMIEIKFATALPVDVKNVNPIHYAGVNMKGNYTSQTQYREPSSIIFPSDYYDQSFKVISKAGMNLVRYLFFWESYEKNPELFLHELEQVAQMADKWKLNIIYTNDAFATSSYLDHKKGYGFPSYLFKSSEIGKDTGGGFTSEDKEAKLWWTELWNHSLTAVNGTDAWVLQSNFLKKIVSKLDKYESTLGYEILNEPHVYSSDQWEKIGKYNTFIVDQLRDQTDKLIFYDRHVPSDLYGSLNISAQNIAKMAPSNITNIVFKTTLYDLPENGNYAENKLHTYAEAAKLSGVPFCLCEFNFNTKRVLSEENLSEYLEKLKELRPWGLAIWIWDYKPRDNNNFNLVKFIDGTAEPTKNFEYLADLNPSIKLTNLSGIHDTISPVANFTSVKLINDTDDSKKRLTDRSQSNVSDKKKTLAVTGEAFDVGSQISSVKIRTGKEPFFDVNQTKNGDWLNWNAMFAIRPNVNTSIVIRSEDNASNIEHMTLPGNIEYLIK